MLKALSKPGEAEQCYQQALALYRQMQVNVRESRDETRLVAGTMVVDSALPSRGQFLNTNAVMLSPHERMVEGTFKGSNAHSSLKPEKNLLQKLAERFRFRRRL